MKDSSIEWIGEIPSNWETKNIGSVYRSRNEKVSDKDYMPLSVTKHGIVPQLDSAAKTDAGDNRKLVLIGDFVINSRSDRRGSCGISIYNGSVSLISTVLEPLSNICNPYYSYVFKTELFADEFYKWGTGIVDDLWSTNWAKMKNIFIPFTEYDYQQRIADYLDQKCTEIDSIIENTKASIEEYKAYKQSVITEVVTKGINPNAPMKDSGVEWIGEIPEHWELTPLKYCIDKIESGTSVNSAFYPASENEIGVMKTSCVYGNSFNPNENKCVNLDEIERVKCSVKKGAIIVSRMNTPELVGACGYVNKDYQNLYLPDRLWQVFFYKSFSSRFIWYYLSSKGSKFWIASIATGTSSSMKNITQSQFSNILMPLPVLSEQQQIADYLDLRCSDIGNLISQKQQIISELESYKKSLIYECVTGKREV